MSESAALAPAPPAAGPPPAAVAPAEVPGFRGLLGLAVGVVVVLALYFAREVLVPITIAILLSFVLAPLVDLLRRIHLGRVPSVLLAVLLALGIILSVGGLIGTQIADLVGQLPAYASTVLKKVDTVRTFTVGRVAEMASHLGAEVDGRRPAAPPPGSMPNGRQSPSRPPNAAPAPGSEPGALPSLPLLSGKPADQKPVPVEVQQAAPSPMVIAQSILAPVLGPLATTGIIFVVAIFILLQREDLRDRLIRLFGSSDLHRTTAAMDDAAHRLSRYFLTQLAINAAFGLIVGSGLFFIGVPSPLLWGILSMLLRFVPYIGSFLAGVLPLALAAAVDPGWSMALWTAALYVVVEPIMGQIVEPMVYGHSTGLSPLSVVVAAIFWGWLWGPIGLILSTPLTLCLVSVGRHVEALEFFDVLLGDRPALTPVESFYQRMLADDPDEAQEHAELLLKERSLSAYYDEVALKGLQLAAGDAQRGVLSERRLNRFRDSFKDLVHELAVHDDRQPPPKKGDARDAPSMSEQGVPAQTPPESAPENMELAPRWQSQQPVMCIAGRGPLDEAAAEMLAQLLEKHGLGAQVVGHDQVSRGAINTLDVSGVAMVCICYLEISGNPAHLRFLLRRLRQRLGSAPIVVGLWPPEEPILTDPALRLQLGADYSVSSLHEAIDCCVKEAQKAATEAAGKQAA